MFAFGTLIRCMDIHSNLKHSLHCQNWGDRLWCSSSFHGNFDIKLHLWWRRIKGRVNITNCYGNQLISGPKIKQFHGNLCFTPRFPWQQLQHPRVLFESTEGRTPILQYCHNYAEHQHYLKSKSAANVLSAHYSNSVYPTNWKFNRAQKNL